MAGVPLSLANAIAIALAPSIPLRVARTGHLSHWKSAAPGHATMSATFAVRLAQAGMTGPAPIFEGELGFMKLLTGELPPQKGTVARPARP